MTAEIPEQMVPFRRRKADIGFSLADKLRERGKQPKPVPFLGKVEQANDPLG
jgi:hypothetical protein